MGVFADKIFVNRLMTSLEAQIHKPGGIILKAGEVSPNMYFIQKGNVTVTNRTIDFKLVEFGEGSFFGEYSIFFNVVNGFNYFS